MAEAHELVFSHAAHGNDARQEAHTASNSKLKMTFQDMKTVLPGSGDLSASRSCLTMSDWKSSTSDSTLATSASVPSQIARVIKAEKALDSRVNVVRSAGSIETLTLHRPIPRPAVTAAVRAWVEDLGHNKLGNEMARSRLNVPNSTGEYGSESDGQSSDKGVQGSCHDTTCGDELGDKNLQKEWTHCLRSEFRNASEASLEELDKARKRSMPQPASKPYSLMRTYRPPRIDLPSPDEFVSSKRIVGSGGNVGPRRGLEVELSQPMPDTPASEEVPFILCPAPSFISPPRSILRLCKVPQAPRLFPQRALTPSPGAALPPLLLAPCSPRFLNDDVTLTNEGACLLNSGENEPVDPQRINAPLLRYNSSPTYLTPGTVPYKAAGEDNHGTRSRPSSIRLGTSRPRISRAEVGFNPYFAVVTEGL